MDAINAIIYFINHKIFNGKIYNVVTGNYTVKQVINIIRQSIPNIKIKFIEHEIMNQLSYEVLNTNLLDIGFNCNGDIRKGILDTLSLLNNTNKKTNPLGAMI